MGSWHLSSTSLPQVYQKKIGIWEAFEVVTAFLLKVGDENHYWYFVQNSQTTNKGILGPLEKEPLWHVMNILCELNDPMSSRMDNPKFRHQNWMNSLQYGWLRGCELCDVCHHSCSLIAFGIMKLQGLRTFLNRTCLRTFFELRCTEIKQLIF